MNKNVEAHYSQLPSVSIHRSIFDLSASYKTTFSAGQLIPFFFEEVLPGDTWDIVTAINAKMSTLLTPIMDNVYIDRAFFYVPARLTMKHWPNVFGQNDDGPWANRTEYTIPTISSPPGGFHVGTLADYFGLPTGVEWSASDELAPIALPFRAYALIVNEFWRDENILDPVYVPLDDANQTGSNGSDYINDLANGGMPFIAARFHDRFSSCLPAPQKGDPVAVPVDFSTSLLPVIAVNQDHAPGTSDGLANPVRWAWRDDPNANWYFNAGQGGEPVTANPVFDSSGSMFPRNLFADGSNSEGVGVNVNDLRLAFAYQRYLEALARSGSRYGEMLMGLFGVRNPDSRLMIPEYLGGCRTPVGVSEVTNTAQSADDFLGDRGAKGSMAAVGHDVTKSFTEHGYLIGVLVARYDHSYCQGMRRHWFRHRAEDYYNPQFANLGETPVYSAELYTDGTNLTRKSVFGYQEIWSEYRYRPNMVTGLMRPNVEGTLAQWNLCDKYDSVPTLSKGWLDENPANLDRCLAVTSKLSPQFWADIYTQVKCTRPMPMYSVPGLQEHF